MSSAIIDLLVKWGPLVIMLLVFISCFVVGLIRGTYKVTRRVIYVVLYVVLVWLFIDNITNFILDLKITINGIRGVREFITNFITRNEGLNNFLKYSPELKSLIIEQPQIIVNPVLFILLVLVGLPLSFPIYWVYILIFNLIAKLVFKKEKYMKNEQGEVLRNEKGKKIKIKKKKHRFLGGLIRGTQGIVLVGVVLMPVNFVNRIYNKAKKEAVLEDGETLCSSIEFAKVNSDICKYLDMYNETLLAKIGGEKSLDKFLSDSLTTIEVKGEKIGLENEVSNVAISAVLINESGIMKLFKDGKFDLDSIDFSEIDFDKINMAIDRLFNSYTISKITEAGVGYVLNEVLNDKLVDLLKDEDIVSKLEYADSEEIKEELKGVVNILKLAVEKNIADLVIDNRNNVITIVNSVNTNDVEALLHKILDLRIISKAMPSALKAYGEKYGINVPDEMGDGHNEEIVKNLSNAIKFVQTMELTSIDEIKHGNIIDNITNKLFVSGAIKATSKHGLANLLNELNRSYLFKDVVSDQLNNLLEKSGVKVDARVIRYVDGKEAWLKEIRAFEKAYNIYEQFKKSKEVNYDNVTDLLNELSGTKFLISILPFTYEYLFPKIGIEIDSEGFPVIDFEGEKENISKIAFYNTWEEELLLLNNIADSINVLKLQTLEDITIDLLNEESNVEALSGIMGEVYKSDLLKEPFVSFMKDKINGFVEDYNVEFTEEELLSVDTKEAWENEFTNINKVLSVDFGNEENITRDNLEMVFNSVEAMKLFKSKKVAILKYAIKNSNFLTDEEYSSISWPASTNQEDIDSFWDNETDVLIRIVDEKDTIESLASVAVKTMDAGVVGGLVNDVMKSNILKPIVVNKISKLLVDNGVKDDRDAEGSFDNLKVNVAGIEDWVSELNIVKGMLNLDSASFNSVVDGKTNVERVFDNIEASELLRNTRAHLLFKAIDVINLADVSVPSTVTLSTLMAEDYKQYNNEKNVFITFAENKTAVEGLDITTLSGDSKKAIGSILDAMKTSEILKNKYTDTIESALRTIRSNEDLVAYGVTFNTNYSSIVWSSQYAEDEVTVTKNGEIDNLLVIKDNISYVADYTSSDLVNNRNTVITKVGQTLDAVSASYLLGEDQAYKIANTVISTLTNNSVTSITKDSGKTWSDAFDDALSAY